MIILIHLSLFHFISLFILSLYVLLMLFYKYHWQQTNTVKLISKTPRKFVSIVIVGRNEAKNIENLIKSICSNDYPKSQFEIIYIDDFSTDSSIKILKENNCENLKIHELKEVVGSKRINNYKKTAIRFAISLAKGDIILQTDADTIVGANWILSHISCYNENTNFVAAPVLFKSNNNLIEQFQKYDFITTMGVTCAGISSKLHFMANGANMSYRKEVFSDFDDNRFASGDDMFLIQNVAKKYSDSVVFLKNKEAIVYTYPESNIKDFFKQRLRWATKTDSYQDISLKLIVIFIFLINFIIISNIFLIPFFTIEQLYFSVTIIIIKLIVDFSFIFKLTKYFNEDLNILNLITTLLQYPFYIITIGTMSLFIKKYEWKGRIVK